MNKGWIGYEKGHRNMVAFPPHSETFHENELDRLSFDS